MLVKYKSGLKAKQLSARILLYEGKDIKRKNDNDNALYCVFFYFYLMRSAARTSFSSWSIPARAINTRIMEIAGRQAANFTLNVQSGVERLREYAPNTMYQAMSRNRLQMHIRFCNMRFLYRNMVARLMMELSTSIPNNPQTE